MIQKIKLKISHILSEPEQYVGKDCKALQWLLTGYLDILSMHSKQQYTSFLATELRCADYQTWEENIQVLKEELWDFYSSLPNND